MTNFFAANAAAAVFEATGDERFLQVLQSFLQKKDTMIESLQQKESESEYRWISLNWMSDLLRSHRSEFVLLSTIGLTHLLQNPFNIPLLTPDDMEVIVLLQHHPNDQVRSVWKQYVLPFLVKMRFNPPKLQTIIQFLHNVWK